jgi:hypothetical protein
MKTFREENKAFREEIKQDIKDLQDNMERNNAKILDSLRSRNTKWFGGS